jgi:ribosome-associated protein
VANSTLSLPASTQTPAGRSYQLALAAARTAADNKGRDIVVLDMREQTPIFDFFVIATGTSRRQLHAMSDEIDHVLEKELGDRRLGVEGYQESHWVIMDYGNVVVHLFDEATRKYYDLEGLWGGAPKMELAGVIAR